MPVSAEVMALAQGAYLAAVGGEHQEAMRLLDAFSQLISIQDDLAHSEFVEMLALVGRIYGDMNEPSLAALNLEDVCAFAEHHFPKTPNTSGDYFNLSRVLEATGNVAGALKAIERAQFHLKDHPDYPKYEKSYVKRSEALIALLRK